MPRRKLHLAWALLGAAFGSGVHAAGGTHALPWHTRGEVLEYRACGCADACWVAQVRSVRAKALKDRLRCDCERLFYRPGPREPERVVSQRCEPNDSSDKSQAISQTLEPLRVTAR